MKPTEPYYRCTDPTDPAAVYNTTRNRADLAFWRQLAPAEDDDVDTAVALLSNRTGQSRYDTLTWVNIVHLLDRYPLLSAHHESLGLLDFRRLRAIERGLFAVTEEGIIAEVDRRLTHYLTATQRNQQLPGYKAIANKIRRILAELDPEAAEQESAQHREGINFSSSGHGDTVITITVAADKGAEIKEILALVAAEKEAKNEKRASLLSAFLELIRGDAYAPRVTFNVYGSADGTPEYLTGAGWLDDRQSAEWADRITDIRDMDQAATAATEAYRPTKAIAAAVRGRDGTCRGPENCDVDAKDCELDHVLNHADGGETAVTNLQALCPRHHNMKTGRRITASMNKNGEVTWTYPDGSTVVTVPNGPLAKANQRFGQSFAQRRTKRIEERRKVNRENPPTLWDGLNEPPF